MNIYNNGEVSPKEERAILDMIIWGFEKVYKPYPKEGTMTQKRKWFKRLFKSMDATLEEPLEYYKTKKK